MCETDLEIELNKPFHHSTFFKGIKMTKGTFLDYVLDKAGDWQIKGKFDCSICNLMESPRYRYFYLQYSESSAKYKLSHAECEYLAKHNQYFNDKLQKMGFVTNQRRVNNVQKQSRSKTKN